MGPLRQQHKIKYGKDVTQKLVLWYNYQNQSSTGLKNEARG